MRQPRRRPRQEFPSLHGILRLIVGNQLTIMRLLRHSSLPNHHYVIDKRVQQTKEIWRHHFNEEVGFETDMGDRPPQ